MTQTTMLEAQPINTSSDPLARWIQFADSLDGEAADLNSTEDVISAFIDRSIIQDIYDEGNDRPADDLVRLMRADRIVKAAAPRLLDSTDVALFRDDDPPSHWWWHLESIVLGTAANQLLNVPEASSVKGVHPHTVRSAIKDGRLPARRLARGFLIHRRDLERWQPRGPGRPRGERRAASDALLDAFNEANTRGDFPRAREVARAIVRDPSSPRRCLALALDFYNHGDSDAALSWVERALLGSLPAPSRQTALLVKGRTLLVAGKRRLALRAVTDARGLGPLDAFVDAALADIYLSMGQPERAAAAATAALAAAPNTVELRLVLGRMEWHAGRVVDALEHVLEYRALRPEDEDAAILHTAILGLIGDRMKDSSSYLRILSVLEAFTPSVDTIHQKGVSLARLGRIQEALAVLRDLRSLGFDPDEAQHAAQEVARAILARLFENGVTHVERTTRAVERIIGPSEMAALARALRPAFRGDVPATLRAMDVPDLGAADRLTLDKRHLVAVALVNAGRMQEAMPIMRDVIRDATDTVDLEMAIQAAIWAGDIELARDGLARIEGLDPSATWPATVSAALDAGEQVGRAHAEAQFVREAYSNRAQLANAEASEDPTSSQWEGVHPAATAGLDRALARSLLN